jgi:hypothetical protein
MEVTVKLRLLLTSALFLFAQMATMQAQETLDLAKITCEQFAMEQLASPSQARDRRDDRSPPSQYFQLLLT